MRTSDASGVSVRHSGTRVSAVDWFVDVFSHNSLLTVRGALSMIVADNDQWGTGVSQSKGLDVVPVERITQSIRVLRGQRVLLDANLAALYGVTTKHFNQQVRRNLARFPADFMFQLTEQEMENL